MKKCFAILGFVGLTAGFVVSCTVGFSDNAKPDKFACESNEDCVEGQVCAEDSELGRKVCTDPGDVNKCDDDDDDGRGVGPNRDDCPACKNDLPGGCLPDCAPDDPEVYPGQIEFCNGQDDNCDGKTEAETGVGSVACGKNGKPTECQNKGKIKACGSQEGEDVCPLESETGASDTRWGCATIDGTNTCVEIGSFAGNDEECRQKSNVRRCVDGKWEGSVPDKCRTP